MNAVLSILGYIVPPTWIASIVIAQVPKDDGAFGVASLITQIGLSGVFLWLFLSATKERQKAQADLAALFERLLPVVDKATAALESVQTSMSATINKTTSQNLTPEDMKKALERLEDVTDDLERRLRRSRGVEE